jgi:Nucleotidyl transferase AbiEii toxin, Type IV TA system
MREVALLSVADRQELFRAASQRMRVHEAIIEKDFWVCWVLDALFTSGRWKEQLVFKGGTSLSKAHGIIERFSEDIDLVLDAKALGIDLDEGRRPQSTASRNRFCKAVNEKTALFLEEEMKPSLSTLFLHRAPEAMFHLEAVGQELRVGYASMRSMLFGTVPDFDTILADLAALESEIHSLA